MSEPKGTLVGSARVLVRSVAGALCSLACTSIHDWRLVRRGSAVVADAAPSAGDRSPSRESGVRRSCVLGSLDELLRTFAPQETQGVFAAAFTRDGEGCERRAFEIFIQDTAT